MIHSRPKITDELLYEIRQVIYRNPDWTRTGISRELCTIWDWRSESGKICDISCRDMLRDLDAVGKITLPKQRWIPRKAGDSKKIIHLEHDKTPINVPLHELTPLRVEVVTTKSGLIEFKSYIDQYHYLRFERTAGESLMYAIYSRSGAPLANLMFGASAWACRSRDEFIGWDREQRQAGLRYTTNNQRYIIYPWVRCDHLASHILGLICRRINNDWTSKYGHGLYLLETFVEKQRFKGITYKASNWVRVGETTGRGRNSTSMQAVLPIKDVYVYPLSKDFQKLLCHGATP